MILKVYQFLESKDSKKYYGLECPVCSGKILEYIQELQNALFWAYVEDDFEEETGICLGKTLSGQVAFITDISPKEWIKIVNQYFESKGSELRLTISS